MSKQRKSISRFAGDDPSLEHALALVQEYTRKLRAISRRIHDTHANYLVKAQERRSKEAPETRQAQRLWVEMVNGFQYRQNESVGYLNVLIPQAMKLAQHVSQLITHGTGETIVKIDLSLRVAELESAINTAQTMASSPLVFLNSD